MLILMTIFLLLFIPLAMVIIHLVRPKFSIQGFLVISAVLAGWPMVFLARSAIPQVISLIIWQPVSLFPNSPTLLIDDTSWYFALALISIALAVIITSIAQLGQNLMLGQNTKSNNIEVGEVQGKSEEVISSGRPATSVENGSTSNWQSWAGILVFTSFGLVAVSAGNMLTLMLAWAALDIIELVILLGRVLQSKSRERIILAFTARMAGIGMVFLAGIIPWSQGTSLTFESISRATSLYLILAAGLRLGVFPLHLPLIQQLPMRRGLGTVLRLVPAASSYILLIRVAKVGVIGAATPYLIILTTLAGLYAGINWMNARDELHGRPFWVLGTSSLAVASAILNQPSACFAWSIASLLSGGLIFSTSMRHKNLLPIVFLGLFNFSALPFSPTWMGTTLFQYNNSFSDTINPPLFYFLSFTFLLIHSLLLAGFFRHAFRGVISTPEVAKEHVERWVWFLYPVGLIFIAVTHSLFSVFLQPNLNDIPMISWIMGALAVLLSVLIGYLSLRYPQFFPYKDQSIKNSPINNLLSLEWLYRFFWKLFRLITKLVGLLSTILEGDGGILWALVLFALIFVFLQR
jgi:hypothetical protein